MEQDNSHAAVNAGVALFLLATNLALFLFVLVNPPLWDSSVWNLGRRFAVTLVAVIAAYAAADYSASHSEFIRNGKPVLIGIKHPAKLLDACYVEPATSGQLRPATLDAGDAIYMAMGTLTTFGWGDIAARSTCRAMTAGELAIGFPLLSLTIAGLAAGLFKKMQDVL